MALLRPRAIAVATGVPVLFAVLATGLAIAPAQPRASADEVTAAVAAPVVPIAPFAVTMADPRALHRAIPVVHRVRTHDPVAFITIDDGVHKDPAALAYVRRLRLPVTAFLSAWTIKDRAGYFTALTTWGSVQNHSATHASFADRKTDLAYEICYSQRALSRDFGTTPWMLRPPYGEGIHRFGTVMNAERCDIDQIVLWDATVHDGRVQFANGRLRPGSILLLHFTPDLARDLRAAVRAVRAAGLTPASLAEYLHAPSSAT